MVASVLSPRRFQMWTVYRHPEDYPESYVARRSLAQGEKLTPASDLVVAPTLEAVRELIPRGLFCMPRFKGDNPQIVEVWF